MISKSLLIGYIAFNGALVTDAFGGGSTGVLGVRNINGWREGNGTYQLRLGGPTLTSLDHPAAVDNEWSRTIGNTRVVVNLFQAEGPRAPPSGSVISYNLTQQDANTYQLVTHVNNVATDLIVQFSVESLASFDTVSP